MGTCALLQNGATWRKNELPVQEAIFSNARDHLQSRLCTALDRVDTEIAIMYRVGFRVIRCKQLMALLSDCLKGTKSLAEVTPSASALHGVLLSKATKVPPALALPNLARFPGFPWFVWLLGFKCCTVTALVDPQPHLSCLLLYCRMRLHF